MYIPAVFAETDQAKLHDFIEKNSFGLLVSHVDGEPFASHLPILLDRQFGPHGCLIGHMARANPQWQQADGQNVLAVFSGPHAYISPTWYEAENVVPTWNYVAVHAYGKMQIIEDSRALLQIVKDFVSFYEASMPEPWKFAGENDFVERLLRQIAGFRIEIARLEGKWKLNQNQPTERRAKVAVALQKQPDDDSQAIAAMMTVAGSGLKAHDKRME
jgi:transcriptional regulator